MKRREEEKAKRTHNISLFYMYTALDWGGISVCCCVHDVDSSAVNEHIHCEHLCIGDLVSVRVCLCLRVWCCTCTQCVSMYVCCFHYIFRWFIYCCEQLRFTGHIIYLLRLFFAFDLNKHLHKHMHTYTTHCSSTQHRIRIRQKWFVSEWLWTFSFIDIGLWQLEREHETHTHTRTAKRTHSTEKADAQARAHTREHVYFKSKFFNWLEHSITFALCVCLIVCTLIKYSNIRRVVFYGT